MLAHLPSSVVNPTSKRFEAATAHTGERLACIMKQLTIYILIMLTISQTGLSQSGVINGFVYSKIDTSPIIGAYIIPNEINSIITTDKNGYFEICDLKPGNYSFGITLIGYKETTISNLIVSSGASVNVKCYLSECHYHILGRSNICPVCCSSDMVIPILWETASKKMIRKSKKGTAYLGGHRTGCDPEFFCKRDSIKY